MSRSTLKPGLDLSTRNQDTPASLRATTMAKSARMAPLINHFSPLMTQPVSVRVAVVFSIRGSDPAPGAGSVIAKQEWISPRASGSR